MQDLMTIGAEPGQYVLQTRFGVVTMTLVSHQQNKTTSSPVSSAIGDHLR